MDCFASIYGEDAVEDEKLFKEYYIKHFHVNKKVCGFDEDAKSIIDKVKAMGLRTALATSPIFPLIATSQRVSWAGLSENDFVKKACKYYPVEAYALAKNYWFLKFQKMI